jgi:microcystin-dependent protein
MNLPFLPGVLSTAPNAAFGLVPVGTIIMWAGNIPKDKSAKSPPFFNPEDHGWMVCDGRSLSCGEYFNLFMVLGNLYQNPLPGSSPAPASDPANTFCIPNFEGYFLRGVDSQKRIDTDENTRTAQSTSDTVTLAGTIQLSAIQTHVHEYQTTTTDIKKIPFTLGPQEANKAAIAPANTDAPLVPNSDSSNKLLVSEKETRPVNIAVYFLIKAF